MKRSILGIVCFVFVLLACQKDAPNSKIRIRFENQSNWNFTNILFTTTQWDAASKYIKFGNLAIGETSQYMQCDTFYRQHNQPEPGSFSANISASERMAMVQPVGPMDTSYKMLAPGDYTILLTSQSYTNSNGTVYTQLVFQFK